MLDAFRLIPALQIIFKTEMEITKDSFVKLNEAQRRAYQDKGIDWGDADRIYRLSSAEPTVVDRSEEKVTVELSIVTESQRQLLLDAVQFVYRASAEINESRPTFGDRIQYLRGRLPPGVIETGED